MKIKLLSTTFDLYGYLMKQMKHGHRLNELLRNYLRIELYFPRLVKFFNSKES